MASKIGQIVSLIQGAAYVENPMRSDYYAALACRDANRKRTFEGRISAMKQALRQYRVTVSHDGDGVIRIRNTVTGAEYLAK